MKGLRESYLRSKYPSIVFNQKEEEEEEKDEIGKT